MTNEGKPDGAAGGAAVTSPNRRAIANTAGCLVFVVLWVLASRGVSWLLGKDISHPKELYSPVWVIGNLLAGTIAIALGEGIANLIASDFSRKIVRGVAKGSVGALVAAMAIVLVVTVYSGRTAYSDLAFALVIMFGANLAGVILYERGGSF